MLRRLVLDGVKEEKVVIVLALLLWGCQRWLGVKWRKSEEEESFDQVGSVRTILADAKDDTVAIQFLFGEFQKGQEGLFAGLVGQGLRERNIKNVVVVIQDLKIKPIVSSCQLKLIEFLPNPTLRRSCQWRWVWWWCESATFGQQSVRWGCLHRHFRSRCHCLQLPFASLLLQVPHR